MKKKLLLLLVFIATMVTTNAQTLQRSMLVDFGPTDSNSGKLTISPDASGNYWTNCTGNTANSVTPLVDKTNASTGISVNILTTFTTNPGGAVMGLTNPSTSLLGDLAVSTATQDFFFAEVPNPTPSLKFTGLNKSKGYKFYVYGCRVATDTRISQYTFTGATTASGTVQTTGTNVGGTGVNGNNSNLFVTPVMLPDANGEIKFTLTYTTGSFGYLNAMRIEEYSGITNVTGITVAGNSITTDGGTTQMAATITPANATIQDVTWSVSDPRIAIISPGGLLTAKRNGTVTVTATSNEPNSTITGSTQVSISNQVVPLKEVFIDFGPNDVTNGNITTSPDTYGNYWNNPTNVAVSTSPLALVDKTNAATGFNLNITAAFQSNGIQNGALLTPVASYLGEFAIPTATQDYFFTTTASQLKFTGLNTAKGYRFRIFGSRDNTETRISKYTFTGSNVVSGTHQTSGTNVGGTGVNRNISNIFSSDMVFPNTNGEIVLDLTIQTSGYAYINVMKMEEFERPLVNVSGIAVSGNDISVAGTPAQMTAAVTPADATIKDVAWAVSDTSIAKIEANGKLHPLKNGIVTVTATTKQTGLNISGSKNITITNQVPVLYLAGSATEAGEDIASSLPLKAITDANGYPTGSFEVYTTLKTGTLNFYDSQSASTKVFGTGNAAGTLAEAGPAIDPAVVGVNLITVNMASKTYSVLPVSAMGITGAAGESVLAYKGQGIWSGVVSMANIVTDANLKFYFRMNGNDAYAIKRVTGTTRSVRTETQANALFIPVEQITTDKNSYMVTLDMNHNSYMLSCPSLDNLKIAYMGSSVAYGTGATSNQGYNYLFSQILSKRYTDSKGLNWSTVNISVPGNNTLNLLARIGTDLFPLCGKYVIFGLSLGNEGIHGSADQEATFNQFKNNMLTLIAMARAKGMVPVMTNNYTRNDYTLTDYSYIRRINMLIHQWDIPSINLLGAIDDGVGHWASGYWYDDLHPNDVGHREFSLSMVPSLFDALDAGKPLPVRATGNFMEFDNRISADQLLYAPDNAVHSFTVSFDFKTATSGVLSTLKHLSMNGSLKIDASTGAMVYSSPLNAANQIRDTKAVNDNQWHKVTLTHFFARGETDLYIDSTYVGKLSERLVPTLFRLNDPQSPAAISYRDWFFYRAGMNADEITALCAGKMLKSGLELYAPLNGQATPDSQLANIAQSTTTVSRVQLSTGVRSALASKVKLYPNPVRRVLNIDGLNRDKDYTYSVINLEGQVVLSGALKAQTGLDVSKLAASKYILVLKDTQTSEQDSLSFTKQ